MYQQGLMEWIAGCTDALHATEALKFAETDSTRRPCFFAAGDHVSNLYYLLPSRLYCWCRSFNGSTSLEGRGLYRQ